MISKEERLKAKILIVDDERVNVLLLEKTLSHEGYTAIRSTTDSRKALDLYQEFKPHLVLLDLSMPHLDGFQVMELLSKTEESAYLPILVLTAQPSDDIRLRALSSGAQDFIAKPFNYVEVLSRIKNMVQVRMLYERVRDQNQILDKKVKDRTRDLEKTRQEVIQRLGRAAEYRDNETGAHVIRMSLFSEIIAREAGLPEEKYQLILNASPMHDVGKIGIPDRILLKPGKLDHDEWQIMKTHAQIGANILSGGDSPMMKMAETIALTHHEQWNGEGYPQGLKGEDIPVEARIVTLADVFDALTSERPYKKAWSVEQAVAEIDNKSGILFDPGLVHILKQNLPELLKIKNTINDSHNGNWLNGSF